jgi:hypothetical protein
MLKTQISKLKKVDLRTAWSHEALDFTQWLSLEENLSLLSEEVGIAIKLLQTEANVGRYNVDILAEEENSGRKIIIENQLEDTNHDHLGKIITYASGYDAEVIIWIVKNYREEHRKAIDWLNEHTDQKISFYLVRLELWQIEDSNPAPKFDIVARPNEWAKVIKSTENSEEYTDTKIKQFEFWTKFKDYVKSKDPKVRLQTPRYQNWYDISMGSAEAHVSLTVNSVKDTVVCELYISKNKPLFNFLTGQKNKIENEIDEVIEWTDSNVASIIKIKKEFQNVLNLDNSNNVFEWLYQKTKLFQSVFSKYLKEYKNINNEQ